MCCGGQCLFFIPGRTGSLIFGYIIAVLSALGTLACVICNMIFGVRLMFPYYYNDNTTLELARTIIIVSGFLTEFLSSFVCTVLLLVGLSQNKPNFIKTFLIYGMLQMVLLLVFFIILHCLNNFFIAGFFILALAIMGIYASCLYMVFKVYQVMVGAVVYVNPPSNPGLVFST